MKYDISKKLTKGAVRVLDAHSKAMFELLASIPFEEITVGKICELSGYPRATFYNYFDDKYDLLDFCMQALSKYVKIDDFSGLPIAAMIEIYLGRLYDILAENERAVVGIFAHNMRDGYFVASTKIHLIAEIRKMLMRSGLPKSCPVPCEIMAEHYANIIILVCGRRYENGNRLARYEALAYVKYLIEGPAGGGTFEK
jgi:AcrR family transcriptional regulator